jgi:acyl carrier protein
MKATEQIICALAGAILGLPEGSLEPEADLVAAGLDSLRMVELLLAVERRFAIEFPEHLLDASSFASVKQIATLVDLQTRP